MSNTTNLGLFKHDNPPTNENQFDVGKSLNENWDKIDEFAGEQKDINSKVTAQGQEIENLNKQYTQLNQGLQAANDQIGVLDSLKAGKAETEKQFQKISKDQERQDKLINGLKDSAINITTDKQKSLHITDSSNLGAKINIFGNSEQKTRSGKNLAKTEDLTITIKGVTVTVKNGEITLNGTANAQIIRGDFKSVFPKFDLEAGSYTFSTTYISGSRANASSFSKTITNGSDTTIFSNTDSADTQTKQISEETENYIAFGCAQGAQFTNYKIKLQLEKGNNKTEWEEYGESPSPQFPSPIKNVGSNINMLKTDASGWEQGGLNTDTGDIVSSTVRLRTKDYIAVKSNTDYYVSIQNKDYCFVNILMYSDSGEFLGNYSDKNFSINGTTSLRVNFGASCDKIKVLIKNVGETTINVDEIPNIKPQLEESSVFTAYREYNCGNIAVSVFNKNWADGNRLAEEMKSFSSTASEEVVDGRQCVKFENSHFLKQDGFKGLKNNYKENTQYTISIQVRVTDVSVTSGKTLYLQIYDKQGNMIGFKNTEAKGKEWITLSYTMPKNTTLSYIAFSFGTFAYWYLDKDSIQIYEANMTGDCPVYEGQKIVFPLEEGQRLMLGDYLGEDEKIHHVRKQFELDGTENWQGTSSFYTSYFVDKIADTPANAEILGLCSHFFVYGYNNRKINNLYFHPNKNLHIDNTDNEFYETLEDWKNFLAEQKQKGTPVIIEIELAEEETEDFTEEQKTAFEQLQNCDMYKPITNITTEENMALIEANYIADTKTYIDNKASEIKEQLNVINELLSTTKTSAKLLDNLKSDLESEVL